MLYLILMAHEWYASAEAPPATTGVSLDLSWWQAIIAIVGVLGLSPAPWILGLAVNRIQFTKTADAAHGRELAAREKGWSDEKAALETFHGALMENEARRYNDVVTAHEQQRLRADTMTAALAESTQVIANTNRIIEEITRAAKEVSPDERSHH